MMRDAGITRRYFLMGTVVTAGALAAGTAADKPRRPKSRCVSPNEKLNVAGIGVGGQGGRDVDAIRTENIVALCDVDDAHAAETYDRYPDAKKYRNYRVMLEKQKDIDAVVIGVPDHQHAIVAMTAIQLGKHVYCEKPPTHSIHEARVLAQTARDAKVATSISISSMCGPTGRSAIASCYQRSVTPRPTSKNSTRASTRCWRLARSDR